MSKIKEVTVFNRLYIFLAFPLVRISIPSNDVRCFFSLLREIFSGFSDSKANLQKVSWSFFRLGMLHRLSSVFYNLCMKELLHCAVSLREGLWSVTAALKDKLQDP